MLAAPTPVPSTITTATTATGATPSALPARGKVREILHREKPPNVGGVGGSAWHATPDWETEPKDAGLNHAADCIEQALAKLRIAEDRVPTELSTRLEP